jgi:hypothetical protein
MEKLGYIIIGGVLILSLCGCFAVHSYAKEEIMRYGLEDHSWWVWGDHCWWDNHVTIHSYWFWWVCGCSKYISYYDVCHPWWNNGWYDYNNHNKWHKYRIGVPYGLLV